jgi:hypothetical protein
MTALKWKSNTPNRYSTEMEPVCFPAGVGNVAYHVYRIGDWNRCCAIVTGPGGGKRKVSLGCYTTMEKAKLACEQHWADGCDLGKARSIAKDVAAAMAAAA